MVELLAHDDRAGFGVIAALEMERVPFRRPAPSDAVGPVVLARHDLDGRAAWRTRRTPTLTIGRGDPTVWAAFGVGEPSASDGPAEIVADERLWPAAVRERMALGGAHALRLPAVTAWDVGAFAGEVLATVTRADGRAQPAVVCRGAQVWAPVELGTALADLLDETYRPAPAPSHAMPRLALAAYYRAPQPLRALIQRRAYRRLVATLDVQPCPSRYPVDASGWLLVETLLALVRRTTGELVRLARWPRPYHAAAAVTHDLEPSRFAYGEGLAQLRARVRRLGHPATYGVVARAAPSLRAGDREALRAADVVCHGLEHRGETMLGSAADVGCGLEQARAEVQAALARAVDGFRSPRLDRGPALVTALDRSGFAFDSSYPDVDRENLHGYGGGVRMNVPFRAPVEQSGSLRPSRCLELPVSAPDCIQPLFDGSSLRALRRAVRDKIAFVRATGGLYVGIVHGGVFDDRDARRRGAHLGFVRRLVSSPDVWLASLSQIAGWWCAREQVVLLRSPGTVQVTNRGATAIEGLCCLLEQGGEAIALEVPALAPGESVTLLTASAAPRRAEGL